MFTEKHVLEGIITRPGIVEVGEKTISRILLDAGIKSAIKHISHPTPGLCNHCVFILKMAHLLYPPFLDITTEEQTAFKKGYKCPLEEKVLKLYLISNRVCAMAVCYLALVESKSGSIWIIKEVKRIEAILDSFN